MNKLMKPIAALMLMVAVVCTACTKDPENGGNNSGGNGNGSGGGNSGGGTTEGVYLGIIGFNDDLKTKTISLLDASSESSYTNFISNLDMRDGTVLYHADNKALDWLQNATLPGQLFNVSLVTFTDGLDNGSTMLNNSYGSPEDYLNAVSNRIRNDRVGGKPITAYSIGLRGSDVTGNTSYQQFLQNLQKLSSGPSNYFEVADWEEAKQRFRQIAIQLYNETTTVNAEVKIPGGKADGTDIRITFDDVTNANSSSQYIQGTYYRENGKGILKNVSYHGLQSSSGSSVISIRQDGIFYWYSFAELKHTNGDPFANTSNMKMWYNLTTSEWQPESEFTPESYSDINVNRKSAVAVLVLDCSSSLGSDFNNMKEAAIEFVKLLNDYGNSNNGNSNNGGGTGGGTGGSGNDTENKFIINNVENTIEIAGVTTLNGMSSLGNDVKSMLFTSADRKRSFVISYLGGQIVDGEYTLGYLGTPYLPFMPCVHVAIDSDFLTMTPQTGYVAKSGTLKVTTNNDDTKTIILENLKLKNVEHENETFFPILDGFLQYHGYMYDLELPTPGNPDFSNIVLNELNGDTKFIEIYNKGDLDLSMEGMYIMKDDYIAGTTWTADASVVIPAHGYVLLYSLDVLVDHPEQPENLFFNSGLSAKKTIRMTLFMPDGSVRDEFTRGTTGEWGQTISNVAPQSYVRIPDGGGWKLANPTPGTANPTTGEDIPQE